MAFFKSSRNHLEAVDKECQSVAQLAAQIRDKCDRSLRGKFEMMQPEQRATLLKDALGLYRKLLRALEAAREQQGKMTEEHADNEEAVVAHGKVLSASLDSQRAQSAMEEGRKSLREGLVEVEAFFGASSNEAKHVRKVLAELEAQ
jgi:hypothetical protein